ncbi:unnamed protein product [Vicia faba]|uniref:Uncharacterized protein n=1 Tax=Vicia faba TaxID=3906 RepID=A0AAV1AAR5_VICFA|nr:unnamed protein product [Vicia faba]
MNVVSRFGSFGKEKRGRGWVWPSPHHIKGALYEARTAEQAKNKGAHSIYKRRSTGDTKVALTDTIYEKVRSSFFPAAIRFALKPEKGRSCYLCNYGLCWPLFRSSTLFSLLCSIESYQTRLTSDQPAKGCEVGPGTKNESISVYGTEVAGRRPLNCSSAIQWWLVPIRQGYNAWSKVQYSR